MSIAGLELLRRASGPFSIRLGRVSLGRPRDILDRWCEHEISWLFSSDAFELSACETDMALTCIYCFWSSEFPMNLSECCPKRDLTSSLFGASGYHTCLPNLCMLHWGWFWCSVLHFSPQVKLWHGSVTVSSWLSVFVPVPPRELAG